MQIEFNGQKEEAYSLTIYKTHAKAIDSGEKTGDSQEGGYYEA